MRGPLAFGLPPSIGVYQSGSLISRYRQLFPAVRLQLAEALSGDLQERLLNHKLDLALLYEGAVSASLTTLQLATEELILIGPAGSTELTRTEIAFADAVRLPMVLPGLRHGLRALLEQYAFRESVSLQVDIEVDSLRVQLELVRQGLGFTILPRNTLAALNADQSLQGVTVVSPALHRQVVLAWRRDEPLSAAAQGMRDLVAKVFKAT